MMSHLMTPGVPTTVISFVGDKPAAIVVPVLTWAGLVEPPSQVALFAPPRMKTSAERAVALLSRRLPGLTPTIQILGGRPDPTNPAITSWVRDHVKGGRIVLLVQPGLNVLTTALSRQLRDAVALATDGSHLFVVQPALGFAERHPLINIGVDALLELHGMAGPHQGERPGATDVVRLELAPGEEIALEQPREIGGFLYGLCRIPKGTLGKKRLRTLERLGADKTLLASLEPRITVVAADPSIAWRARTGGFTVISPEATIRWQPNPEDAGNAHGSELGGDLKVTVNPGVESKGTLLTWLGLDATPTLTAIFSHRPSQVLVLVDTSTGRVVELAHRLLAEAAGLPVQRLRFVASDLAGSIAPEDLASPELRSQDLDFNCQAGTAMQTFAVAATTSARLWSIKSSDEGTQIVPLLDATLQSKAVVFAPITLLAKVNGGTLNEGRPRPHADWTDEELRTLADTGRAIAGWLETTGQCVLPDLATRGEIVFGRDRLVSSPVPGDASDLHVRLNDRPPVRIGRGGLWLEDVVFACVALAGADEVVRKIEWLMPRETGGITVLDPRDELDVIARFGSKYFLFDCKAGRLSNEAPYDVPPADRAAAGDRVHRSETEALAKRLSRFTIPIAVRPRVMKPEPNAHGAAVLDLSVLTNVDQLKVFLDTVGRRSTTIG